MNKDTAIKATYFSIIGNIALVIIKLLGGIFGNSHALISDAIESSGDIVSSFLVFLGIHYSNKPADKKHPYGHGKAEPLITFSVVLFLVASATIIAYESIINLGLEHKAPSYWTLFIIIPIIIWKELSFQFVMRKAKETNSSSLKADAWHHRSDSITSTAAFIGISIALIMGKGWEHADDWASLFAALFIYYNSYKILLPALGEVMEENTFDELTTSVIEIASSVEGVLWAERCLISKYGMKYHSQLNITVERLLSVESGHQIGHNVKEILYKKLPELEHILIHIEPSKVE